MGLPPSATLEAPVGSDKFGYGYRSKTGDKLFDSHPMPYGASFGSGDVIGVMIYLPEPPADPRSPLPAHLSRAVSLPKEPSGRIPIAYKGHAFFEEKESFETEPPPGVPGSFIEFFKNGESNGIAFRNIPPGEYYPAISLYNGATVYVNFRTQATPFKYPPPQTGPTASWRAVNERFSDRAAEDTVIELAHEVLFGEPAPEGGTEVKIEPASTSGEEAERLMAVDHGQ